MPETDRVGDARRILVYGVAGSGKSTMARRLSELTGIPWTSVDDLTWNPGWVPMPAEEQLATFDRLTAGDSWILDSAYGTWRHLVVERADLVVALDYPRWRSFGRLLRRTAVRILDRREICNGNRETLWSQLGRDSILVWQLSSFRRKRAEMRAWAAAPDGPLVVRVSRPAHARRFLTRSLHCQARTRPSS